MDFTKYIKFYEDRNLIDPSLWGVYQFPDGQNQFWCKGMTIDTVDRLDISICNPTLLDLCLQICSTLTCLDVRILYKYGARSDKYISGCKSVCNVSKLYTDILNSLGSVDYVEYLDPHDRYYRGVYLPKSGKFVYIPPIDLDNYSAIIFPDKSAQSRANWIPSTMPCIQAEKVRDQETGAILYFSIPELEHGKRYLVVDDICDGGATFIKIAESSGIKKEDLSIYFTHGVLSNNATPKLAKYYGEIFTTNSYIRDSDEGLTVFNVWGL